MYYIDKDHTVRDVVPGMELPEGSRVFNTIQEVNDFFINIVGFYTSSNALKRKGFMD